MSPVINRPFYLTLTRLLTSYYTVSTVYYTLYRKLHKGGDALDLNNYRPISIICSIAKVFEKCIYNQLSHYLSANNILSPFQSGFRSNRSTSTALLKFMVCSLLQIMVNLQVHYLLTRLKLLTLLITIYF